MKKGDLHVLFLVSWYPSHLDAQNGNFIQRHAEAVAMHCRVSVLYPKLTDEADKGLSLDSKGNLLEVLSFRSRPSGLRAKKQAYVKACEDGLQEILKRRGSIHVLHVHVYYPAAIVMQQWKKRFGVPTIVTEHSTIFLPTRRHEMKWPVRLMVRWMSRHTDVLCPVSQDLGESLKRYGRFADIQVVPNVVEVDLFPLRQDRTDGLYRWLHVSTLDDQHKNVTGIIEAFAQIVSKSPHSRLTLIGNAYQEKHRNTVARLGLDDQVSIHEEMEIHEIGQQMSEHDAFVLFSHYENLPCVISEAKVAGLQVVATDVGGVKEMLAESDYLVQAGKVDDLVEAMLLCQSQKGEHDHEETRSKAMARYAKQLVGQQYTELYFKKLKSQE